MSDNIETNVKSVHEGPLSPNKVSVSEVAFADSFKETLKLLSWTK